MRGGIATGQSKVSWFWVTGGDVGGGELKASRTTAAASVNRTPTVDSTSTTVYHAERGCQDGRGCRRPLRWSGVAAPGPGDGPDGWASALHRLGALRRRVLGPSGHP